MWTTAAIIGLAGAKATGILIATGTCLAVGFWIGKKITNKLDEVLILNNKEYMNELMATA